MRWILGLFLMFTIAACSSPEEPIVAQVDGQSIRVAEFRLEYVDYLLDTGLADEPMRRQGFLNRMISRRLLISDGRDRSLIDREALAHEEDRIREKLLIEAWLDHSVYDTLDVTTEELEAIFGRINTKLTASHLYAPTREAADALAARLANGETFEALAREVFTDPKLAETGGSVGTFGFDETDPSFEDAAFALPVGGISEPVQTSQGWSIIRLDDKFTTPLLTQSEFAARQAKLTEYIRDRKKASAKRRLADLLLARLAPEIENAPADALVERIFGVTGATEDEAFDNQTLVSFTLGGKSVAWSVAEFQEASRLTDERQRSQVQSRGDLDAFIQGLVARSYMTSEAERLRLDRTDRFSAATAAAVDEWIYAQVFNQIVDQIVISEDTTRAVYDANPNEFFQPERVTLHEIVLPSKAAADSVRSVLGAGRISPARFQDLARRHSTRPTSAEGGYVGLLTKEQLGPWADAVFAASPGTVLGPFEAGGSYLVLQPGPHEPPGRASFAEVQETIEASIRREKRQQYLRSHLESLHSRYEVSVKSDVLAAIKLRPSAQV